MARYRGGVAQYSHAFDWGPGLQVYGGDEEIWTQMLQLFGQEIGTRCTTLQQVSHPAHNRLRMKLRACAQNMEAGKAKETRECAHL